MNFGDKSKLWCVAGPIAFNGTLYNYRGFCVQNFANGDSASFHYEAKGKLGGGITGSKTLRRPSVAKGEGGVLPPYDEFKRP